MSPRHGALEAADASAQQSMRDGDGPDLLTQEQVCRKLGISNDTWTRWRKAGRTPKAVELPSGRRKWRREDIDRLAGAPAASRVSRFFQGARGQQHRQTVARPCAIENTASGAYPKGGR
jgi:predicted DNA-binding transcriptional regulator AlpA